MKPGDYVKSIDHETNGNPETGIILSAGYNMWGEEIEGQETRSYFILFFEGSCWDRHVG